MSSDFLNTFSPFLVKSSFDQSPTTRSKFAARTSQAWCTSPSHWSIIKNDSASRSPFRATPINSKMEVSTSTKSPKKVPEAGFLEPLLPKNRESSQRQEPPSLRSRKFINFDGGQEEEGLVALKLQECKSSIKLNEVFHDDKDKLSPINGSRIFSLFPHSEENIGMISPQIKSFAQSPHILAKIPSKGVEGSTASSQLSDSQRELDLPISWLSPQKSRKNDIFDGEGDMEPNHSNDEFLLQQMATRNFSCFSPTFKLAVNPYDQFEGVQTPVARKPESFSLKVDPCKSLPVKRKKVEKKRVAKEMDKKQLTMMEKLCQSQKSAKSVYQTRSEVNVVPVADKSVKKCNCSQSKCLKLYCECFASGTICGPDCGCKDCCNQDNFSDVIQQAKDEIIKRDPNAFVSKVTKLSGKKMHHRKGCTCKKSGCLKGYCECYQLGVLCTDSCKCQGCSNCQPDKKGPAEEKAPEKDMKQPKIEKKPALARKKLRTQ